MDYIIVGGYGTQAQAIGQYLLKYTDSIITIYDKGPRLKGGFHEHQPRVHHAYDLIVAIKNANQRIVISCVPTQYNASIARIAAQYGHHYIDLGGQLEHTDEVIAEWESGNPDAVCIPDCGVAPGLVSSIIGKYIKNGAKNIEIFCGGIPKYPDQYEPHRYGVTFNPEGVIKEYTGVVTTVENGLLVCHAALDGLEEVFVSGLGYLEAVHMSGSLSKTPELLLVDSDQSYSYKTLRWHGHWRWVKENVLTQPNPNEIIQKVIPRIHEDYLVLLARIDGKVIWQNTWEYDGSTQLTGMQQATGYTVGAIATMIADGTIKPGLRWMHDIDFHTVWTRMPDYNG